jgi:hypothetical protein
MIQNDSHDESEIRGMKQLSLRGFDDELEKRIRETARREGISLNRAALLLLRKGAGIERSGKQIAVVGDSLDHLIGKWSSEEAGEFLESIKLFEQIDRSFWK